MSDVNRRSTDQSLDQLIQRYQSLLLSGWSAPAKLLQRFEKALADIDVQLTPEEIKDYEAASRP